MNSIIHKANTRGHANHGWLNSFHTFSFASYYEESRIHFGALRVLNDDTVAPGAGFGTHPHKNMEIISIPLEGELEHKDSMDHISVIRKGDIQVMSAGKGVYHSEYNHSSENPVKFLQIWIIPNEMDVTPRYDQITIESEKINNQLYTFLGGKKDGLPLWIHQNARMSLGKLDAGKSFTYTLSDPANGIYIFIISGQVKVGENILHHRDGLAVQDTQQITINTEENTEILLMEVPISI